MAAAVALPAAAESVDQLLVKYGLLGIFAADCSKPAASGNMYQVVRLIDANAAQIDQMDGATTRAGTIFVDRAESISPDLIRTVGTLNDFPFEAIWQTSRDRRRLVEARVNGVQVVRDGIHLISRQTALYLSRCKSS